MVLTALLVALGGCSLADGTEVAQAQGTVYLTFDDGPVRAGNTPVVIQGKDTPLDGNTPAVLDVLRNYRVNATFFVVAEQAREHPNLVYREYAQGHSVQNHSDTHPDLTRLTNEEIRRELAKLLVEKISIGRNDEDRPEVQITYRFGPPKAPLGAESADGVQNSEEFARAHGQGGGEGLLWEHPKVTVYEVAVEREAARLYGPA